MTTEADRPRWDPDAVPGLAPPALGSEPGPVVDVGDLGLRPVADASVAAWISGAPWNQLVTFGPPGFAAYARVRFIPDPIRAGQHEADVEVAADHPHELDQTRQALRLLAGHTAVPEHGYVAFWEGYGLRLTAGPREPVTFHLPHRSYTLLEGPLDALRAWGPDLGASGLMPPAFVWPADHAWCFAGDVVPHWAGVGGSAEAIRELVDDPALDVVPADPRDPQPHYV